MRGSPTCADDAGARTAFDRHNIKDTLPRRCRQGYEPVGLRRVREVDRVGIGECLENTKLKRLVADLSLDKVMLEDLLSRKW